MLVDVDLTGLLLGATLATTAPEMARLKKATYKPNPAAQKAYDQLYAEYLALRDYFERGVNDVMKRLKHIKVAARRQGIRHA